MGPPGDPNLRNSAGSWSVELGQAMKARRHALGLNQRELALLAGVGERLVHEVEHGKSSVRLDKLVSVLRVLGLQLELGSGGAGVQVDDG